MNTITIDELLTLKQIDQLHHPILKGNPICSADLLFQVCGFKSRQAETDTFKAAESKTDSALQLGHGEKLTGHLSLITRHRGYDSGTLETD